ncbi:DUF4230 domain-containing protein [Parafilimonas sp.]|uniref:DUF4230 domain-containing protein n=1 Tax=Parafilimonas sp. TaxID=1969739 RepID=UPI0039E5A53B
MPSLSNLFKPQKVVIENTPVVVKQIQSLSQLITVSMYSEIVADTTAHDIQSIHLPLLPAMHIYKNLNRLVIIGKVTVNAGIDLQQLQEGDISGTKDSLHIKLPHAGVLDAIINPSGIEVFIEDGEWSDKAVAGLKNKIQYLAVAEAQSRGLSAQSETKARQVLTDFFMAAGYKKVVVEFKTKPPALE